MSPSITSRLDNNSRTRSAVFSFSLVMALIRKSQPISLEHSGPTRHFTFFDAESGLTMSLRTPSETVEKLQTSLQTKAKAEPAFRFYALWDKVCRKDVPLEAYRRCRAKAGAPGVDSETFERIETHGLERWLETLWEELTSESTSPSPSCGCGYRRATEANGLRLLSHSPPFGTLKSQSRFSVVRPSLTDRRAV